MNFFRKLFLGSQISQEHQEMLEQFQRISKKIDDVSDTVENISNKQEAHSSKLDEIDKRLSSLEDLTAKNFSSITAQTELLLERLESINRNNYSVKEQLKILPRIKFLIDSMNEQIQLTPLNEIEIDNLSDSDKLLVAMVKEIEKITQKSSKELGNLIDKSARDVVTAVGKKVDNKKTELNNQIVDNLEIVQRNLEQAIYSRNRNGVSVDQIRSIVKEETRRPGSRNSYL